VLSCLVQLTVNQKILLYFTVMDFKSTELGIAILDQDFLHKVLPACLV